MSKTLANRLSRAHEPQKETAQDTQSVPRLSDFESPALRAAFHDLCGHIQPDFVLVEYVWLTYLIHGIRDVLPDHTRLLIDTHDVMHLRFRRFSEKGEPHGIDIDETEETDALSHYDAVLAIQERDAEHFRKMIRDRPILTVGHPQDCVLLDSKGTDGLVIGFVGSPVVANVRAVRRFFDQVWPALQGTKTVPVAARIYGNVCQDLEHQSLPSHVRLMGFVADGHQPFRECDIFINPVDIGGGLKIKNVEALCHGKPLVTTPVGAEGLEDGAGDAFVVCEDADEMAAALDRLILNPVERKELGLRAFEFARNQFSENAAYGDLLRFLENPWDTSSAQQSRKASTRETPTRVSGGDPPDEKS